MLPGKAHLEDFFVVVLEYMQWLLQLPHVMQCHLQTLLQGLAEAKDLPG